MKHKPYLEHNTALTPGQQLRVAVAVLIWGWDQHKVAALMDVNPGRVNKAVKDILRVIDPQADIADIESDDDGDRNGE